MRAVAILASMGLLAAAGLGLTLLGRAAPVSRTIDLPGQPLAVAIDSRAGRVVVANSPADAASVLDMSGRLLATARVGREPEGVASDERTGHTFVINTAGGSVSMLDSRSGALIRTTLLHGAGGPTAVAVAGATGRVFTIDQRTSIDYGSGTAFLSVLDARTGRLLRTIPLGAYTVAAYPGALGVDERAGRVVAVGGGDVTGVAFLLDARTGTIIRAVAGVGTPYAVAVAQGHNTAFLVDAGSATIVLLDTRRGTIARRIGLAAAPYAVGYTPNTLAVDPARDRLLIAGTGRGLRALDISAGTIISLPDLGSAPTAVAVDARRGRIYALDRGAPLGPGRVLVLDARTGRLLRTITVGVAPAALALDDRTGRLFVANSGGPQRRPDRWWWTPSWLRHLIAGASPPPIEAAPGSLTMIDGAAL